MGSPLAKHALQPNFQDNTHLDIKKYIILIHLLPNLNYIFSLPLEITLFRIFQNDL